MNWGSFIEGFCSIFNLFENQPNVEIPKTEKEAFEVDKKILQHDSNKINSDFKKALEKNWGN